MPSPRSVRGGEGGNRPRPGIVRSNAHALAFAAFGLVFSGRVNLRAVAETAGTIQGDRNAPLRSKRKLSEDEVRTYGRKMTEFGEWCAEMGMPISYHHHMAAPIETEEELDLLMNHSGEGLPLLFDEPLTYADGTGVLRADVAASIYSAIEAVRP